MGSRNFNINLILRILLIIISAFILGFIIKENHKAYTKFLLFLIILIQSILLINYINRINKEIVRFLKILGANDSGYRFSTDLKGNFAQLAKILNSTSDLIVNSRIEKEQQYKFLQFVIEHIHVGLLAFNDNGDIQFINSAMKDLLKIKKLETLSDLREINTELVNMIFNKEPEISFQIKIIIENNPYQILVQKKLLKMNNQLVHLVSFQNITAELDKKELDSWQRLIRILTHEIMNSLTPIINLTYSIQRSLKENVNDNEVVNALEDVEIIENRSKGLLQFVENYRKLTKVGKLELANVDISVLLKNTVKVFREDFQISGIECRTEIEDGIYCALDDKLFAQAIINILKNAYEALHDTKNPRIEVVLEKVNNAILIKIADNGKGIENDKLDDIFIPFYTTKENLPDGKAGGTGIGLSFVKQIISLHKGTITVNSKLGEGTSFRIEL